MVKIEYATQFTHDYTLLIHENLLVMKLRALSLVTAVVKVPFAIIICCTPGIGNRGEGRNMVKFSRRLWCMVQLSVCGEVCGLCFEDQTLAKRFWTY